MTQARPPTYTSHETEYISPRSIPTFGRREHNLPTLAYALEQLKLVTLSLHDDDSALGRHDDLSAALTIGKQGLAGGSATWAS